MDKGLSRQTYVSGRAGWWLVVACLGLADIAATVGVFGLSVQARAHLLPELTAIDPFAPVRDYASLWPVLVLVCLVRAGAGLYPGYGRSGAAELRAQTYATLLVAGFVLAGGVLFRFAESYSRLVLVGTALGMVIVLPPVRAGVKALLAGRSWYGVRIVILGRGPRADAIKHVLDTQPELGLRVAETIEARRTAQHCLLVEEPGQLRLSELLDELNRRYRRVWLIPELPDVASVWVAPRDLRGHLALEIRNNLLEPRNRALKRMLDIAIVLALLPIALPLGLLLAAVLRLDSSGPVIIRHQRVGRNRRAIQVRKLRTMRRDADTLLEETFQHDPQLRREWEATHKLRRDPRVTRVGRFLRRTSLDELPQLWNVLKGEMSLVGPRPIVEDELPRYGPHRSVYLQLAPGLTGLAQVSGRSELAYEERVRLDAYYARNWSVWLDIVILARTGWAVVTGRGAY